jgi:hypothetical protein
MLIHICLLTFEYYNSAAWSIQYMLDWTQSSTCICLCASVNVLFVMHHGSVVSWIPISNLWHTHPPWCYTTMDDEVHWMKIHWMLVSPKDMRNQHHQCSLPSRDHALNCLPMILLELFTSVSPVVGELIRTDLKGIPCHHTFNSWLVTCSAYYQS